jgi:hypothetical protein
LIKIQDPKKIILAKKKKDDLRIMIDLDGVMCNWTKAACKACGLDYEELKEELKKEDNVENHISEDEMWKKIDAKGEEYWTELELYPWANKLYKKLQEKSPYVCFLTSPAENEISLSGKAKWVKKHFDNTTEFLIGKPKWYCANKNTLLIDNSKKNTDKFDDFNGNTFLWPNSNKLLDGDINVNDTIKELMEYIDELRK